MTIRPNAIEVKVHLYHNSTRRIMVSSPDRTLIHSLAQMLVRHGLDTFPQQSRRFVIWCISMIEHNECTHDPNIAAMEAISIDAMRAILEYSNRQLDSECESGSVEVDDSDCQLSDEDHLREMIRTAWNKVQMDYTVKDVTTSTVANLELALEKGCDLLRLAKATVANRESEPGQIIDRRV